MVLLLGCSDSCLVEPYQYVNNHSNLLHIDSNSVGVFSVESHDNLIEAQVDCNLGLVSGLSVKEATERIFYSR